MTWLLLALAVNAEAAPPPAFLEGLQALLSHSRGSAHEHSAAYVQLGDALAEWTIPAEGGPFHAEMPRLDESAFREKVKRSGARDVLICVFHTHPAPWPREIRKLPPAEIRERGWQDYLQFGERGMRSIPPGGTDVMIELGHAEAVREMFPGIRARDQLGVVDASGVWYYSHLKDTSALQRELLQALSRDSTLSEKARQLRKLTLPPDLVDAVRKPWMLQVNRDGASLEAALAGPWLAFLRYGYARAGIDLRFTPRAALASRDACAF